MEVCIVMQEVILTNKKHGMRTLLICIAIELVALAGVICGAILMEKAETAPHIAIFVAALVVFCVAWIPLLGLRVLKPQEALALTLFGKYAQRRRFLLGESFLYCSEPCSTNQAQSKRRREP